jgi:DNA-binding PadR family transcriptional regulator
MYQIGSQCQKDAHDDRRMSNGALFPALKRLHEMCLLEKLPYGKFRITSLGREMLVWEIDRLNRMVKLVRKRLRD